MMVQHATPYTDPERHTETDGLDRRTDIMTVSCQ